MELQTVPGEGGRSEMTTDSADQGPVAYLEQLVGELMDSLAAARPTAGKDAGIELEAG
jgi:hypothetical protein